MLKKQIMRKLALLRFIISICTGLFLLKKQLAKKDKELKRKEAALAELAAIMTLKKSLAGWTTVRKRMFNFGKRKRINSKLSRRKQTCPSFNTMQIS